MSDHYLKLELDNKLRSDSSLLDFVRVSCLDGMWYWDLENPDNEWMSPDFWETFGYDPATKQHKANEWQDLINQDDLAVALDNFNKHCEDPSHPYDQIVRYRHKDGHDVWVRCRGLAIRDENGKPIRMLGAHTDVTKQMQLTDELRRQARHLSNVNNSHTRFLAQLSHEMRNALNVILGLTRQWMGTRRKELNDTILAQAATMHSVSRNMERLVEDMLEISRIEAGTLSIVATKDDSNRLTDTLKAAFEQRLIGSSIRLSFDTPEKAIQLDTDCHRVEQILRNLLDNACKYTDQGSIRVTIHGSNKRLIVDVRDTGRGIPADKLPYLFEAYHQAANDQTGMGLGLSISRHLARLLGGDLLVRSSPGKGSTFTLDIPATLPDSLFHEVDAFAAADAEYEKNNENDAFEAHPYITTDALILDSDDQHAKHLVRICRNYGWTTVVKKSIAEATEWWTHNDARCIICDWQLADGNILKLLQGMHRQHGLPVTILYSETPLAPEDELLLHQLKVTTILRGEAGEVRLTSELLRHLDAQQAPTTRRLATMPDLTGWQILIISEDMRSLYTIAGFCSRCGAIVHRGENLTDAMQQRTWKDCVFHLVIAPQSAITEISHHAGGKQNDLPKFLALAPEGDQLQLPEQISLVGVLTRPVDERTLHLLMIELASTGIEPSLDGANHE